LKELTGKVNFYFPLMPLYKLQYTKKFQLLILLSEAVHIWVKELKIVRTGRFIKFVSSAVKSCRTN
jgi:hypothetical protein